MFLTCHGQFLPFKVTSTRILSLSILSLLFSFSFGFTVNCYNKYFRLAPIVDNEAINVLITSETL